jgi:hypothetical protein
MHISIQARTRIIAIYSNLKNNRNGNKISIVQRMAAELYSFEISTLGNRNLIKWMLFGSVQDRPRGNKHKLLITNVLTIYLIN